MVVVAGAIVVVVVFLVVVVVMVPVVVVDCVCDRVRECAQPKVEHNTGKLERGEEHDGERKNESCRWVYSCNVRCTVPAGQEQHFCLVHELTRFCLDELKHTQVLVKKGDVHVHTHVYIYAQV